MKKLAKNILFFENDIEYDVFSDTAIESQCQNDTSLYDSYCESMLIVVDKRNDKKALQIFQSIYDCSTDYNVLRVFRANLKKAYSAYAKINKHSCVAIAMQTILSNIDSTIENAKINAKLNKSSISEELWSLAYSNGFDNHAILDFDEISYIDFGTFLEYSISNKNIVKMFIIAMLIKSIIINTVMYNNDSDNTDNIFNNAIVITLVNTIIIYDSS